MPRIHDALLEAAAGVSPTLTAAIEHAGPLSLPRRRKDELLPLRMCRAVAGQQLSVAAASTIWARLLERTEGAPLLAFVRDTDAQTLRSVGLSHAKARTMQAIAAAEADGVLDVASLGALDHPTRVSRLTEIWGVGTWTADMVGIFYFRDPDIWPDGDVTARKTLVRLTSARRKTVRTAARFAPYRSYLALHMWRAAHAQPA